jgi:hypothetical protein
VRGINIGVKMASEKVGECQACGNRIFVGQRSNRLMGHKSGCKNFGTRKLDK